MNTLPITEADLHAFVDGKLREHRLRDFAMYHEVAEGDLIVVLEAMKMEQPINAHRSGIVSGLNAQTGETVASGTTLCEILDPA